VQERPDDDVIDNDLILVWGSQRRKRQANNVALFGNRQVVEVEKVLHSSRFELTDVATVGSGAPNQGADVTLVKIGNAFNAEPPIEQYRRRGLARKNKAAREKVRKGRNRAVIRKSVARKIRLRGDLAEQRDHDCRDRARVRRMRMR
jgi:hypothetical protein